MSAYDAGGWLAVALFIGGFAGNLIGAVSIGWATLMILPLYAIWAVDMFRRR